MLKIKKINEDKRGKIYIITGDDLKELKEATLLITKKDFARGSCVHKEYDEHCIVLEGKVHYVINEANIDMEKGNYELIPKSAPHYFVSLTDSVVLEFGVNPDDKGLKDEKMKKVVDEINGKAGN